MAKHVPTTLAKRMLQHLWAKVLDLLPNAISTDNSFFCLGSDSIATMKLASIARENGLALTMADVFQQLKLSCLSLVVPSTSKAESDLPAPFSLLEPGAMRDAIIQLAVDQCRVRRDQVVDIYPCTALQEGLMALTAKTAGAYVAHFTYRLPAHVDLDRFRAAWDAVARANPILHTRIVQHDELGSFQVVVLDELPWTVYDNEELCSREPAASFSMGNSLVRLAVITNRAWKSSPQFILTMHHAVYDAWTLPLLLKQAAAALAGEVLIPRPFSPFIGYVLKSTAASEAFWRSQFTGLDAPCFPPLPTPAYTPNPTESTTRRICLPQGLTDDFTVSTKLRLAWALTLSQYTSTQDVVFGLTVTGRAVPVVGIEQITGPTIATLPLRVRVGGDETVVQALQRVQDQSAAILPYEQTGLQNIRRLSDEAAAACQFQSLLVIAPARLFTEAAVNSSRGAFTTYALTLLCDLFSDSVTVQTTFDPRVIGATEAERMLHQLAHVAKQICSQPEARIKDVGGASPEDYRQLQEWNGTVPARVN
ncbi:hypothetical protein BJY00DRAFT_315094 [Aspergillus carlsbadensis]|nr:hypothetical protein BJY00DRAFT_315094 [Aspergillus carlsbadensis]